MNTSLKSWLVLLLLLGTTAYCVAEQITLTTYYPSPRGVYHELRTLGNIQVGNINPPALGSPAPRLHVIGDGSAPVFQVDASASSPNALVVDRNGNVGIGISTSPHVKLRVAGMAETTGPLTIGPLGSFTPTEGMIVFDPARGVWKGYTSGAWWDLGGIPRMNVTQAIYYNAPVNSVATTCNGRQTCNYNFNYGVDPGYDPAFGVYKTLSITYTCSITGAIKTWTSGAGFTSGVVNLACP